MAVMPIGPIITQLSATVFLGVSILFLCTNLSDVISKASGIRLAASFGIPSLMALRGLRKQSLSPSGCALALWIGFVLTLTHPAVMLGLIAFFLTSSKATRFRQHLKRKIEGDAFKAGGQRNWIQVFCNGGVVTSLCLYYLIRLGPSACNTIKDDDLGSRLIIGALGAIACSCGDTWASELGPVLSKSSKPFLITTLRKVPKGTNGGVSFEGLIASLGGGFVVGISFAIGLVFDCCSLNGCTAVEHHVLLKEGLKLVFLGGVCGLAGSLIDSILGATLQYSALNRDGSIAEFPAADQVHVSGICVLDNHCVNLMSGALTAAFAVGFLPMLY